MTPGVRETLDEGYAALLLERHLLGDWGDLCDDDHFTNELSLRKGGTIMSSYETPQGKVWIITDDCFDLETVTTILRPDEY